MALYRTLINNYTNIIYIIRTFYVLIVVQINKILCNIMNTYYRLKALLSKTICT